MTHKTVLSDALSRLVAYLLPVTYFLVAVSFYLKTYDSAQIKISLFQIGCSLTAVLWVVQLLLERRWPFRREDLPLAAPFLAVLASGLLSWAHSDFPAGSFDETLRRVLYAFMGFIVLAEFRGFDRQRRLLRWLLAGFLVVVFYGFVQYLDTRLFPPGPGMGLDPFVWRQAFGVRVFSTFGNPNFYGNFLVIVTPVILITFLKNGGQAFRPYLLLPVLIGVAVLGDKLWLGFFGGLGGGERLLAGAGLALLSLAAAALVFWRTPTGKAAAMLLFFGVMFLTLYATETKGAWVGFVGAVVATSVLTGLFLTGDQGRAVTRRLLIVAAVTAVLGGSAVLYYARQRVQSVSFRVFTWISTWEMIREHPLLGSGVGTFKWIYPAYRRPEIILLEAKSNTETDHAEDEYLEVWSDEGVLGLGLFLWLVLTVSVAGLSTLRRLTAGRGPPEGPDGERVYALVAILGAWWAALLHWSMDVSVRFVSSGVYSFLLPALVARLSGPEAPAERQDAPSPLDGKLRAATALFWTGVFLALPRYYASETGWKQVFPAVLMGVLLWGLGELLESRLAAEGKGPAPVLPFRPSWPRIAAGGALLAAWGVWALPAFRGYFAADLHHNIAIFFSKSQVWAKGGTFDAAAASLPPPMKEEYDRVGGALDHYAEVVRLNPFFPMARYFIGNVYNDWGSLYQGQFQTAKARGLDAEAAKAREAAEGVWAEADKAYGALKAFAPNYVQMHHQVGTLFMKRMQMKALLGDKDGAKAAGDAAMSNFELYRALDPVFPQNYYRMAQIHLFREDLDAAEDAYRAALVYNTANVVNRVYDDRNAETYVLLGRLALTKMDKAGARFRPEEPLFAEAEGAFASALKCYDALGRAPEYRQFGVDAHKGLGLLYLRAGDMAKAAPHWGAVRALAPEDPDLRAVTGR